MTDEVAKHELNYNLAGNLLEKSLTFHSIKTADQCFYNNNMYKKQIQ